MALSAADQIALQQALSQLAQAASSVARYSSTLNTAQQTTIDNTQTLNKYQKTTFSDYDKLSKVLQTNTSMFKETVKTINDYKDQVKDLNATQQAQKTSYRALQSQIDALGVPTKQLQDNLTLLGANIYTTAQEQKKAWVDQNTAANNAIQQIIDATNSAMKYRTEYERDFFGRKLATEVRDALGNIAGGVTGSFSKQLLTLTDLKRLSDFADAQATFTESLLNNNNLLDDSNKNLAKQYVELGNALGYTSAEFTALQSTIAATPVGGSTTVNQDLIQNVIEAQGSIAETISNANENLSRTIDRDLSTFGSNLNRYMYENRNGFEELIDELRDIRSRTGSLTSGEGRAEAGSAISEAVGKLGDKLIPALKEAAGIVLVNYTREYDALMKDYVQTDRLVALRLNMTEDQYRQSRSESKMFWNVANADGQKQLDQFMVARRRQLEATFGSDPTLVAKMGARLFSLTKLSDMSESSVMDVNKTFRVLGKTSRLSTDELADMYFNIAESNENQLLMRSLDAKERKARLDSIKTTMSFGAGLGMSKEALDKFTTAMLEAPSKAPSASELVNTVAQTQISGSFLKAIAGEAGLDINKFGLGGNTMEEYGKIKAIKDTGLVPLTAEQTKFLEETSKRIADFDTAARTAIKERAQAQSSTSGELQSLYKPSELFNQLDKAMGAAKIDKLVDPFTESATAIKNFSVTGDKMTSSLDHLSDIIQAQIDLADKRDKATSTAEAVTGTAAGVDRFVEGAKGNMWTNLLGTFGGSAIGSAIGTSVLRGAATAILPEVVTGAALGPILAGIAATGAVAYGGYKLYQNLTEGKAEEASAVPPKPAQTAEPAPNTSGPLPSTQVNTSDSEKSTNEFNDMFKKYMETIENQNDVIKRLLGGMSTNSDTSTKVMQEWYKLYQDLNPITPIDDNKQSTSKKDTSSGQ